MRSRFRDIVGQSYLLLILLTLALSSSLQVGAQDIGLWNFTNVLTAVAGANNTVSLADFSPGIPTRSFNGGTEYYGENGWPPGGINTSSYLQFTLTPKPGFTLNILSLILRMRRSNTGSPAGAGPTSWSVRSSLDGYTANISSGSMTLNYANYTVSPGVAFATLPTAVTFRVYGYNATTSTGGSSRMVFDYVEVTGLGAILPIHLTSFTVRARSRSVALTYTVTNAEQGTRYMIERSVNGTDFAVIHSGTETGRQEDVSYDYEDQLLPPGISRLYYRLHIVEAGGHSFYSSVVSVSPDIGKSGVIASIKNNVLTISGSLSANSNLILFSNTGTVILQQQLNNMAGPQSRTIMIPFLARGVYYVSLISAVGKQSVAVMAP